MHPKLLPLWLTRWETLQITAVLDTSLSRPSILAIHYRLDSSNGKNDVHRTDLSKGGVPIKANDLTKIIILGDGWGDHKICGQTPCFDQMALGPGRYIFWRPGIIGGGFAEALHLQWPPYMNCGRIPLQVWLDFRQLVAMNIVHKNPPVSAFT